ncbi:MAG TPA: DNA polymerase III subunit delta' [Alphaproteobacteria bacterium]|nr:DNA polymerase III subunit delta' [Alphaproteobacteria bacterium]
MDFDVKQPEEQSSLFGFDAAQNLLLDLWNRGTLAGAWLFCGPKGIGKATLAYRLARFVLAQPDDDGGLFGAPEPPKTLDVPESDPVFGSIAQRTNPGLKVVEFALKDDEVKDRQALIDAGKPLDPEVEKKRRRYDEIRVTDIRDAENFLHLTAGANGWRVMIIDAADDMNVNAENALLKSLEEPPAKTLIILISHVPGKLLPTIRSRCRKLLLKPLPDEMLTNILKSKINGLGDDELVALTRLARGSLGRALSLIDADGVKLFRRMLALFADFPLYSVARLYDLVEKTLKDKDALKLAQTLLLQWLTNVCVCGGKGENDAEIFAGEIALRERVQRHIPVLRLMELIDEIRRGFADIDLDQKQVFVNAFSKLQRGAK